MLGALRRWLPRGVRRRPRALAGTRWMGSRNVGPKKKKPELKALMKKFYIRTHPDLFENHPEKKEVNERSLQQLNEILNQLKDDSEGYPPQQHLILPFYCRVVGSDDEFEEKSMRLSTTGGSCRTSVGKFIGNFFGELGFEKEFSWGKNFWKTPLLEEVLQEEEAEKKAEERAANE